MEFQFRTKVNIDKQNIKIDYNTSTMFIGSCFSNNIGNKLKENKFESSSNPFGVLYNPASIAQIIQHSINKKRIKAEDLILHNGLWHSFDFHGSFSNPDINETLLLTNKTIENTHSYVKKAEILFVTFGTAWAYSYLSTGNIVSNCHKIPSNLFKRKRLSVPSIIAIWKKTLDSLELFNPKLQVVFTVSPVRHLKDGAHENQLSKATLLLAIDQLIKEYSNVSYFPAYEIVMDELRDYRFYNNDMTHLTDLAVDYIFEKFKESYFHNNTSQFLKEISPIILGYNHRILSTQKDEIKKFANNMLKKISSVENKYGPLNFTTEKKHFNDLINQSE